MKVMTLELIQSYIVDCILLRKYFGCLKVLTVLFLEIFFAGN